MGPFYDLTLRAAEAQNRASNWGCKWPLLLVLHSETLKISV